MRALVVGGTGPTGPHVVEGLLARGYEVTIFHRGVHEPEGLPAVEHIHADPHFKESIAEALSGREFEVVLAMYGRVRHLAEVMAGRCARFISVGGAPVLRGQDAPEKVRPFGLKVLLRETDAVVTDEAESKVGAIIALTERIIFDLHAKGAFSATHVRYAEVYGPRSLTPKEWQVLRRARDGRRTLVIPDAGLLVTSRVATRNAAHGLLLALDQPDRASGQIYHCADDEQFTLRQWYEMIIDQAGVELDLVSLPERLARPFHVLLKPHHHMLMDTAKIRRELGYKDAIATPDAIREGIEWWRKNPVTPESHPNYRDRFAYEQEDEVVAAYLRYMEEMQQLVRAEDLQPHGYAHPKKAGGADHRGR